jgi:hypothetical protein
MVQVSRQHCIVYSDGLVQSSSLTSATLYTHPFGSLSVFGVGRQYFRGILTMDFKGVGNVVCQRHGFFTSEAKVHHGTGASGWCGDGDWVNGSWDWSGGWRLMAMAVFSWSMALSAESDIRG